MKIIFNNQSEEFQHVMLTLSELLSQKEFSLKNIVVLLNGEFVKRNDFDKISVRNGDTVMAVNLFAGG